MELAPGFEMNFDSKHVLILCLTRYGDVSV